MSGKPNPTGTLRVEGACKQCANVVKTTAAAGRVTWVGECPQCGHKVTARAPGVPSPGPAKKAAATPPAAPAGRAKRKVPRVEYDQQQRRPEQGADRPAAEDRAPDVRPGPAGSAAHDEHGPRGDEPAGPGAEGAGDEPGAGPGPAPDADAGDEHDTGGRRKRGGRRRRRLARAAHGEAGPARSPYPELYNF